MVDFMIGIFQILTTDLFLHFFGIAFCVCSGLLVYHAVHMD